MDSDRTARDLARSRLAVFSLALLAGLLVVFVAWRAQTLVAQAGDIYRFAEIGRSVLAGHGFRYMDGLPTIRRAPLYPLLIAALYLLFGERPIVIQLFQCVLAAGTCLLAFEIGRRLFSLRTGLLAAAMLVVHPMVLRYIPDIQVETFLTFLYTLTVYRTVLLIERETILNGLWVGVSAAAAAMVKGVALPYPALFIVAYLLWRRASTRRTGSPLPGWKPMAALLLGMAIVILPWTFRNYEVTGGRLVLISGNASGEFLRGYVFAQPKYYLLRDPPYTVGENEANEMQRELFRRQGLVWEKDEAQTEQVQNVAAKQQLKANPGAFVRKVIIGFFMFWYVVTTRTNSLIVGGLAFVGWGLAAAGCILARGTGRRLWLLFIPIFSLNLVYALVLALGRYSAPCIPSLMVLAAFGCESLIACRRTPASQSISSG